MAQVDADVEALLKQHEYLQLVETGEGDQKRLRIRCDLTQHEMLPRRDAIETHLKGKKFLKAKAWYCYDYSKYEPYIVEHRRKPKSLFCNVTNTILNRIPAEVEKHVNGKKFLRLKEHVTFTRRDGEDADDGGFDANAFEFENQQLIYSDLDDDEDGKPRKKKKKNGSDDDDDSDNDDMEDDEDEEDEDDSDVEDDMAEFYPQDDDDDENEADEHIREAVKRLSVKKRKASAGDESLDESMHEQDAESPVPKPKKLKANGSSKPKTAAPKPRKGKKGK